MCASACKTAKKLSIAMKALKLISGELPRESMHDLQVDYAVRALKEIRELDMTINHKND